MEYRHLSNPLLANTGAGAVVSHCPKCGAPVYNPARSICEYCGGPLQQVAGTGKEDWTYVRFYKV